MDFPYLSFVTFAPLVGALLIALTPIIRGYDRWVRGMALLVTTLPLIVSIKILLLFNQNVSTLQFVEGPWDWVPTYHIQYLMGIDGLSVLLVVLTTFIGFMTIILSWQQANNPKGYFALLLVSQSGLMGVFCALDGFLLLIFWQITLLPLFALISHWGGIHRHRVAIKTLIYTSASSIFLLIAMIIFYLYSKDHHFNLLTLTQQNIHQAALTQIGFRYLSWGIVLMGAAVTIPIVPFHTWFVDAIEESPLAVNILLAAVMSKMGLYLFMRLNAAILPDATGYLAWLLGLLGAINIIYGTLCALSQSNLKRFLAYMTIAHLGFCLLGIASFTSEGMTGAVLHMVNHITIATLLFIAAGILWDRAHQTEINSFGGLSTLTPRYALATALIFFAAMGVPGFSFFVSNMFTLVGSFQTWRIYTIITLIGLVLIAAATLLTYQKIFFGKVNELCRGWPDLSTRELGIVVPLLLITVASGLYPQPILNVISPTLIHLQEAIHPFLSFLFVKF
jgi:NADH-quinone oxidoreductase subunit M